MLMGFVLYNKNGDRDYRLVLMCYSGNGSTCRSVGSYDGNLYQSVKSESNAWFDVSFSQPQSGEPLYYGIEATKTIIPNVEVIGVTNVTGDPNWVSAVNSHLPGMKATVSLGILPGTFSSFTDKLNLLVCNNLFVDNENNKFSSRCFGPNWNGYVTYKIKSAGSLNDMIDASKKELDQNILEHRLGQLLVIPIFVYAFLILSGLIWLVRWMIKFVKAADE